ncbi:hypothetical protein D0Y65_043343 [Glycine soja]|uniref:Uncharacterized protein n=1 Tax=Glycine soja TaxID=3848 RepID=A0A445GH16_GLYSO|nr:hypothetical protein D0Y65_043343 [Glycine soja]
METSASLWYVLKSSVISALSEIALKPSDDDLGALQQLLVDQPNIQIEEGLHESQHQNIQIPDVEQEAVYFQLQ